MGRPVAHHVLLSVVMAGSFISLSLPDSSFGAGNDQNVNIRASRSLVNYGGTVTVTAHLVPYQSTPNKIVSIHQQPYGGPDTEVASGPVDDAGNLSVPVTPPVNTSFYALWSGDPDHDPSQSDPVLVRVRVLATGSLGGSFGASGEFRLYHFTWSCPKLHEGCPAYTVGITPNHAGATVHFQVQRYESGTWHLIKSFDRTLDSDSARTVIYIYSGSGVNNAPLRIRAVFDDDADHVGRATSWSSFQVVRELSLEVAGDIACQSGPTPTQCHQGATSDILVKTKPTAVLTLGDNQYWAGQLWAFRQFYSPTWGRMKAVTHPSAGNHDYATKRAAGYFTYFGPAAGDPTRGYYSFEVGGWHIVALNSEIDHSRTSRQVAWLKSDLTNHSATCTLAFWHRPRWASGRHGNDPSYGAFWAVLYRAHADVVLNGHDHDYERFALQTPNGSSDPAHGIREFVVGTGGVFLQSWGPIAANSQVRYNGSYGVLRLTLGRTGYSWRFLSEAGKSWTDQGTTRCH